MRSFSSSPPKEPHIPMWDSSDPTRNPPPMPLQPDSPNLSSVSGNPNGIVANSPFHINASPTKPSFHSRNTSSTFMSINEERIVTILETSRDLKDKFNSLETSISEIIGPDGQGAQYSENLETVKAILQAANDSKDASQQTFQSVDKYLPDIISSIESENESHKHLSSLVQSILQQTNQVSDRYDQQESNINRLVSYSQKQDETMQTGGGLVNSEILKKSLASNNSTIIQSISNLTADLEDKQSRFLDLLNVLKNNTDNSLQSHSEIVSLVNKESEKVVTQLKQSIQDLNDLQNTQNNAIPTKIEELQSSLTNTLNETIIPSNSSTLKKIEDLQATLTDLKLENSSDLSTALDLLHAKLAETIHDKTTKTQNTFKEIHNSQTGLIENSLTAGFSNLDQNLKQINKDIATSQQEHKSASNATIQRLLAALESSSQGIITSIESNMQSQKQLTKESSDQQISDLKDFLAQNLETSSTSFTNDVKSLNVKQQELLASLIQSNFSKYQPLLEKNTSNLSNLEETVENISKSLKNNNNTLISSFASHSENVNHSFDKHNSSYLESLEEILENHSTKYDSLISSKLDSNIDQHKEFLQTQQSQQIKSIEELLSTLLEESKQSIVNSTKSQVTDIGSNISTLSNQLENITGSINSSSLKFQTDISTLDTKITQNLDGSNESLLQKLELLTSIENILTGFDESYKNQLLPSIPKIDKHLDEVSSQLNHLQKLGKIDSIDSGISEVNAKIVALDTGFSTVQNDIQTLSTFTQTQNDLHTQKLLAVEDLLSIAVQPSISNIDKRSKSVQETVASNDEKIGLLLESLKSIESKTQTNQDEISTLVSSLSESSARSVLNELEKVIPTIQGLNGTFSDTKSLIESNSATAMSEFEKLNASISELFSNFDSQISDTLAQQGKQHIEQIIAELSSSLSNLEALSNKRLEAQTELFANQIGELESKLEAKSRQAADASTKSDDMEQRIKELEQKLQEEEKRSALREREFEVLKYMTFDLEKHEENVKQLEEHENKLRQNHTVLEQQLSGLEATCHARLMELEKLEKRVEGFEKRLNLALLHRSKSILGSATMSIINSNMKQGFGKGPNSRNSDIINTSGNNNSYTVQVNRSNTTATSGHGFSGRAPKPRYFARPNVEDSDFTVHPGTNTDSESDDGYGKENDQNLATNQLQILKKRNPNLKNKNLNIAPKTRSVSLFTPNQTGNVD